MSDKYRLKSKDQSKLVNYGVTCLTCGKHETRQRAAFLPIPNPTPLMGGKHTKLSCIVGSHNFVADSLIEPNN
jgi:hypothetical protein